MQEHTTNLKAGLRDEVSLRALRREVAAFKL